MLGIRGAAAEAELEQLYLQAATEHPFTLVAFLSKNDPAVPEGPANRPLQSLKDVFTYMDDEVQLWKKRYAWEHAADEQWQHYIDDLSTLFAFLDNSENLAIKTARKQGIVQ